MTSRVLWISVLLMLVVVVSVLAVFLVTRRRTGPARFVGQKQCNSCGGGGSKINGASSTGPKATNADVDSYMQKIRTEILPSQLRAFRMSN